MARVRQGLATLAFAVLLCAIARPVAAQVNTATVFGSVKDAQGGVIPGATVTLISDTQGTKVGACRNQRNRRFRVSRHPCRHLHRPGRDAVVQDAEALGPVRQRRFPRGGRDAHDRRGRRDRDRPGQGRISNHSGGERRAFFRPRTDHIRQHSVRQRTAELRGPRDVRPRHGRYQPPGQQRPEHIHDGRRVDDGHGQQRAAAPDEPGVDRRSEDPHVELSGGVRPVDRRPDRDCQQERLEPVSWQRLRHLSQQPMELGEREDLGQREKR